MTSWSYTVSPPADPAVGLAQKTATQYALMMRDLLPPGVLWRRDLGGTVMRVLLGAAEELARVSGRSVDLVNEADPRTTLELLEDFERELQLESTGTDEERRARIVARLTQQIGVRPVDYQEILAPILDTDPANVIVIEQTIADGPVIADPRQIYQYYIYRDPGLPGAPNYVDAQEQVTAMEHAQTRGVVIGSINFLTDDPNSLTDRDLLGV